MVGMATVSQDQLPVAGEIWTAIARFEERPRESPKRLFDLRLYCAVEMPCACFLLFDANTAVPTQTTPAHRAVSGYAIQREKKKDKQIVLHCN